MVTTAESQAPTTPDPSHQGDLSPQDGLRLAALFEHHRSPFALAAATGDPLHEILNWLARTDIQEHIERITALENDAHRAAAIALLRELASKTEDLIEKRRIAYAIIRGVSPSRRRDPRPRQSDSPIARHRVQHEESDPPEKPETPPVPAAPVKDLSLLPAPSPDLTPEQVVTTVAKALRYQDTPFMDAGTDTLQRFAAPDFPGVHLSSFNFSDQVLKIHPDIRSGEHIHCDPPALQSTPEGPIAIVTTTLTNPANFVSRFTFFLRKPRDGPHQNCWLIFKIDCIDRMEH